MILAAAAVGDRQPCYLGVPTRPSSGTLVEDAVIDDLWPSTHGAPLSTLPSDLPAAPELFL